MLIFNFLLKNPKHMLSLYLFNKSAVVLNTASEPVAGTPEHAVVHSCEYLNDGGHQAGLDTIGISLKFAQDKIAHQLKIFTCFGS